MSEVKLRGFLVLTVGLLWIAAVGAGMARLLAYENTPGADGNAPAIWPKDSRLPREAAAPTLVMAVHPQCPCSRASIGELARLMTRCQGRMTAHVMFIRPSGVQDRWVETDLWRSARAIPGVTVSADERGVERDLFHSETSGMTLLYDSSGHLLFEGGITSSRGHSGDNEGSAAIESLLKNGRAGQRRTAVFGCSLLEARLSASSARE